ncbi:ABC transporter permease subunit [Streptomyces sp. JJ36]|uniref:ABC transporter permease subunit n=1 Tax=Streptomyces sp. JJ36 TaxID=2736645 RepID=UPI001F03063A|nr:ABC transporter permease subunit [Streptomyces sp. JJ36]MCF6522136.1 ABC transporter permease subunit [Streptomyces sp. JJ36]
MSATTDSTHRSPEPGPGGPGPAARAGAPTQGPALYHPTVGRLTYRALLGRRRALLLCALPALLLAVSAAVRAVVGADDTVTADLLTTFALSAMLPLVGVIAGTGAIGPEIDDGSIVYLLAKPLRRPTVILTKLFIAFGVTLAFAAVPTLIAGFVLNGNSQQLAVAFAVSAVVASLAYSALFLLLGTVSRHAVVIGLVYALVWEALVGNVVPGARTLSVQQWALSLAERIAGGGLVTSEVSLPVSVVLLTVVTVGGTWLAGRKLRTLTLAAEQ